jgi:hypothetical protein
MRDMHRIRDLEQVLSRLVLQILDKNPTVPRRGEDLKEIQSQLAYEGPDRVKALSKTLLTIINLHNDRLFIVLDRPDLCELAQNPQESRMEYIQTILHLVEGAKSDLKMIVVQRSEIWGCETNMEGRLGKTSPKWFKMMRLDQCKLKKVANS